MSRVATLILLLAAGAAIAPLHAVAGEETVGRGDFEFFLDVATFRNDDGTSREELYVRIPNPSVRFKAADDKYEARARMSVIIRNSAGEKVVDDSAELEMYAPSVELAESVLQFQTLIRSYDMPPGVYRIDVAIEDLNSPKISVVAMFKGELKNSVIRDFEIEVPAFPQDRMSFSDAMFLWSAHGGGVPNPARLYGLYRDSLLVYVEAYVPAEFTTQPIEMSTSILNEAGEMVKQSTTRVQPPPDTDGDGMVRMPVLLSEDLNLLVAGSYALYINGGTEDQLLVRVRSGAFNVAWDMRTWETSRRNFIAQARFLLEGKDFDEFVTKSVGEQEAMLRAMWKELDPDPATGVNEAYEEFMDRLDHVNAKYTDYQLGIFTDRGLIYLKYGPPDETIVDVIPLNRESLSDALQKVQDKYHAVNFSNTGVRVGYARPSRDIIVDPRRLGSVGEQGDEGYPYELWVYNGPGEPLLKRDQAMEQDIGLRFIFVDREGYGRYRLESSSSMANK